MSKVAARPKNRVLPSKENSLFKELLNFYESRQLKKGLKTADQILKKVPDHGETLCMKGLVLVHMGRREEGVELVKKGMRLDLTSHITWHVFGLIQKGEKNYEEALKSYTQALRFEKDNLSLLRDSAHMQSQLRIYDGLVDTRHTLLKHRPNLRQNWIGMAVAYHLSGNLQEAKNTIEQYHEMIKNVPDYDVDQSESLLYRIKLLEEMGKYQEALTILNTNVKTRHIVDKTLSMEFRARLLLKLKSGEASEAYRALIDFNPESYDYYKGYLTAQGVDSDPEKSVSILQELCSAHPKARASRRLVLTLSPASSFASHAEPYITQSIQKGIPSIFSDVKSLYDAPEKRDAIETIVESYKSTLQVHATSGDENDPTVYLWTLYFLAQHYSHLGQHSKALELLDEAQTHTPTLPEIYTCRGRVLKRAGDLVGAANAVNDARLLDGQDRFLNTKCAKYRLRAGQFDEAHAVLGLFTKKDAPSPQQDLEDMQSLLYLIESGNAYKKYGPLNMALKRYNSIHKIFDEMEDDQYDFHGYCIRKFTLNAYTSMLTWADQLRSHPTYVSSAIQAAGIFVTIHDNPELAKAAASSSQLTDEEKKALKKAKKAAAAQKNANAVDDKKQPQPQSTNEDKGIEPTTKDDDPDGKKLLSCSDPLDRAWKLLQPLLTLVPQNLELWLVVFDISIRRNKILQAIKALNNAKSILSPSHPGVHVRIADLQLKLKSSPMNGTNPAIDEVLKSALLPEDLSLDRWNAEYLQNHPGDAGVVLAHAKVAKLLGATQDEFEEMLVNGVLKSDVHMTIPLAQEILDSLSPSSPRKESFQKQCSETFFPISTMFKTADELAQIVKAQQETQEKKVEETDV